MTRMDMCRWRSHGLLVCTGRFDGVLVATRMRAHDGVSVRHISGVAISGPISGPISGAISGGPVRHLLAGTGWALGAWLLSEDADEAGQPLLPDTALLDTAPRESCATVDEMEFSHKSSHRSTEAPSKREPPRLRVCTVTARQAAELPRVVLSSLPMLLS